MVLGIILVIVLIATAAHNVSQNLKRDQQAGNLGGPPPAAQYKVGDTANTSGFRVTVFAVKDPQPPASNLFTPPMGTHWVSVDVQVTNPESTRQPFSSLIAFRMMDAENHQWGEDPTAGIEPGPPDGQIPAGQSIRGFVTFAVADGTTTGLKLRVQGSITASGAVFTLD